MSEQREHYRIKYRSADRPSLHVAGHKFDVLDISEQGLRFDSGLRYKPEEAAGIRGKLIFKSGKSCAVEGSVLRHDSAKHTCVVRLTKGIPLAMIMAEQRMILQKYNTLE